MKKTAAISALILGLALLGNVGAAVVRPAANFTYQGPGKVLSLKSLHGQPVVLIIARSAKTGEFRKQAKRLKELYHDFASKDVVFVAAFKEQEGVIPSDVPFVVANNGAQVAADYQIEGDFGLVVIGPDGNVDLLTTKLSPATRIRDAVINSYSYQSAKRSGKLH